MTDKHSDTAVIQAAGGLVWRDSPSGKELAVIHRVRYGDWTLPKGKLKPGERWEDAALREVKEETGCSVQLGSFAGSVSYLVNGVPKVVLFWNMDWTGECAFQPSEEVGEVVWLSVQEALAKLDYLGERNLLMDNHKALIHKPSLWSRFRKALRSASLARLANSVGAHREELEYLIRIPSLVKEGKNGPWADAARSLLDKAQQAVDDGDEDLGWRRFHAAQRMELFGLVDGALTARAQMVLREAEDKLEKPGSWRLQAIRDSLCKDKSSDLKDRLSSTDAYYASEVLHEHFANTYHKLRLVWAQLARLSLVGLLAVIAVVGIWAALPPPPLASEQVQINNPWLLFSVVLFGVMGASMSGILSLARDSAGRIPERLVSLWITLARFIVAAVSALAVYTFLFAGLLQLGKTTPGLILAASFAAGFSEQLVVRAVETLVPKKKS